MQKHKTVIAICIQEPTEDGSKLDLGPIKGDDLRFLHQAFITDTILGATLVDGPDIRLYYIGTPDRIKLVSIVSDYVQSRIKEQNAREFKARFKTVEMAKERWGKRIETIFKDCFNSGYDHVLVVGSRTPTVRYSMMASALRMLEESDAVFGPTPEGRYYVIGMSGSYRVQLSRFDWKSPSIYSEVATAFEDEGMRWSELEIWYCVETPEEIEMMIRDINQFRFEGDEISAKETEKVMERILARLEP